MLVPRPGQSRRLGVRRTLVAALLALVGHAAMVAVLLLLSQVHFGDGEPRKPRPPPTTAIALRPVDSSRWAQNRGEPAKETGRNQQVAKKEEPKEKKAPEEAPKGQVVDVAPGNAQAPERSDFLAETNNTVKKETHAKDQTPFYRNAMPQRTSSQKVDSDGKDPVDRALVAGNSGQGDDDKPLAAGKSVAAFEVPKVEARSEVAMRLPNAEGPGVPLTNRTESEEVKGNSTRLRLSPGDLAPGSVPDLGSRGRFGEAPMNLLPSAAVLDRVSGAAPNDHLRDVDEGDGTFLNTREWKYASFFNRLKQSVGYHWDPNSQLRLRDPTGQIYWGKDRETLLAVTLDANGRLKDVFVQKASGLDFLDVEAVKSFERAQPFPNPPPGMLEADGSVRFTFGFHVTLSSTPGVKLFRGSN